MRTLLAVALASVLAVPGPVSARAEIVQNNAPASVAQAGAEPWRPLASRLKPRDTVKIQLQDGSKTGGRVVDISDRRLTIRVNRWWRERETRTLEFSQLRELSQTHPIRNGTVFLAAFLGTLVVLGLYSAAS